MNGKAFSPPTVTYDARHGTIFTRTIADSVSPHVPELQRTGQILRARIGSRIATRFQVDWGSVQLQLTPTLLLFCFFAVATNGWSATYDPAADFEKGFLSHSNPNGVWSYGSSTSFTAPVSLYTSTSQPGVLGGTNTQTWSSGASFGGVQQRTSPKYPKHVFRYPWYFGQSNSSVASRWRKRRFSVHRPPAWHLFRDGQLSGR